jgi:hypothetical protein
MSPCSRILRRNLPSQLILRVPLLGTSHSNTICSCLWARSAPAAQHLPTPPTPARHHAHACATRSAPPTNHSCAAAAHACCLIRAPGPLRASLLTPGCSPPPGSCTCCARTRPARHCSLGAARIQHIRAATARCHTGSLLLACRHATSFAPAPLGSRAAHAFAPCLPHARAALTPTAASPCAASPLPFSSVQARHRPLVLSPCSNATMRRCLALLAPACCRLRSAHTSRATPRAAHAPTAPPARLGHRQTAPLTPLAPCAHSACRRLDLAEPHAPDLPLGPRRSARLHQLARPLALAHAQRPAEPPLLPWPAA